MVDGEGHTQILSGLCSLIGRVWMNKQRVKSIYGPSVTARWTAAAILVKDSSALVRKGSAKSVGPFSSAFVGGTRWKVKKKNKGVLSRREQNGGGSERGECPKLDTRTAFGWNV